MLKKYNLPLDRSHIVAHATVPSSTLAASPNHVDPGPYWLWDYYFHLISQQGVSLNTSTPPHTITLHPTTDQTLNGPMGPYGQEETAADYNFFSLYNGSSTASGLIPAQNTNDITDVSYSVEPGISYYYVNKTPDAAGTGDTMYEIWYGVEDQVHTSQHSYFADGHLAWLAVPAGAGVEGTGLTLYSQAQVILSPSDGSTPQIYGRPTTSSQYIIGDAPACRDCPFHAGCTNSPARVLIFQPNEQAYQALQEARDRAKTPAFYALYKLQLQALFTATAMNVLRACAWIAEGTHASTPVSRFARLIASVKSAAAA